MKDILFLTVEDVLEQYEAMVNKYGGERGLRDPGLLESAVAMPKAGIGGEYFHSDLYEMAAAYMYHIILNHPFVDGNKRAGLIAAMVFLWRNDVVFKCDLNRAYELTIACAEGRLEKDAIAEFFRKVANENLQ